MSKINQVLSSTISDSVSQSVNINRLVSKFDFCLESILYRSEEIDKILKKFKKKFKKISIEKIEFDINTTQTFIETDEFCVILTQSYGNLYGDIFSENVSSGNNLKKFLNKYENRTSEVTLIFDNYSLSGGKLTTNTVMKSPKDYKDVVSDFYPFLDTDEFFRQFLDSDSNILILHGERGCGKSKFIALFNKFLVDNIAEYKEYSVNYDIGEPSFIFSTVKNEQLLSDDGFWSESYKNNPCAIFLDDLDGMLHSRTNVVDSGLEVEKNKFVSQLLSFSDGIHKDSNRTKVIITTNQKLDDIDSALTRKGRLFDILEFRELTREEALKIWKKNFKKEEFPFDSDLVRQSDLADAMDIKKREIKKNRKYKNYLLDDSVSSVEKHSKKRVGLV